MVRGVVLVLAVGLGCGSRVVPPATLPALTDGDTYTRLISGLRATLARSKVEIDTQPVIESCSGHGKCVRCDVAGRADTAEIDPEMIDGVAIAFARYPTTMLAAAQLEHVALCRKIRFADDDSDGTAGVAILEDHRLLVSIEHFVGKPHNIYAYFTIEEVVHHELFHLFDYATQAASFRTDHAWEALDPAGFEYRDPAVRSVERPAGFVNSYATTDEAEDRASVFEYLMGQPARLCEIAHDDPIVAAKTAVVWKRVAKVTGDALLHRHAPCVDWIDRKRTKPVKPTKPAHPTPPGLRPRPPISIVGKMR